MNRPLITSNAESIADALQFAQAAADYLGAKQEAEAKRWAYKEVRNTFMHRIGYEPSDWEDLLSNPGFIATTAGPFQEYKTAKQLMYNAERRMMTRYRRINNQGVA